MTKITRFSPLAAVLAAALLAEAPMHGQTPPAGPKNLVSNGGFESSFRRENLWDGVDSGGFLSGERGAVPILTTSGVISEGSMPVSVSIGDLNGDNLADIATMDPIGYLRVYFNSGTPQEPKFTLAELGGVFLSRFQPVELGLGDVDAPYARLAPRLHLTSLMGTGKKDLLVGNYIGEILLIPNQGTVQKPDFRQPLSIVRMAVPTTKDSNKRWGNVFAPVTWDWNKDGKEDLLLGEGSYSANNIHLLINQGTAAKPVFDENNKHVIAFGDGLEQLTPAVVDYNGDGMPDLIVGERSGKIAVYLNKGGEPKAGEPVPELPFASFISAAGSSSPMTFPGIATVAAGDLNGDGLFDIVVGKTNGRIALVMNTGSKTEPKFAAPADLKGDANTPPLATPSGWDIDYGLARGNYYAFATVVKGADDANAQPAEGTACLKVGYMPSPNKIMPPPTMFTASTGDFKIDEPGFDGTVQEELENAPARFFTLRQLGRFRLTVGKTYTLSFKVRGGRVNEGTAIIGYNGFKKLTDDKVTQGDRGSADVQKNEVNEDNYESVAFSSGPQWTDVRKDIRVSFKAPELKELATTTNALLQISFSLPPGGGDVYFDDVQLVEKAQ